MSEHIREFTQVANRSSVTIDMRRVTAVRENKGTRRTTCIEAVTGEHTKTYEVEQDYTHVCEVWQAAADAPVSDPVSDALTSLLLDVRNLAELSGNREEALLAMHEDVRKLSASVAKLASAVERLGVRG